MDIDRMIAETLLEKMKGGGKENRDYSLESLKAALERETLKDLQYGDVLVQVKLGKDFLYNTVDNPAIFIRYLTDMEKAALIAREEDGMPVTNADIVIASYIDLNDGQLITYPVESTHYTKA